MFWGDSFHRLSQYRHLLLEDTISRTRVHALYEKFVHSKTTRAGLDLGGEGLHTSVAHPPPTTKALRVAAVFLAQLLDVGVDVTSTLPRLAVGHTEHRLGAPR
tara:strand:+ start:216 stop:524 length:309 start_codon:yes stop_codon:yes gene_type:complete